MNACGIAADRTTCCEYHSDAVDAFSRGSGELNGALDLLVLASRPLHRKIDGTGTARRLLRQRFSSLSGARLFNAIDYDE